MIEDTKDNEQSAIGLFLEELREKWERYIKDCPPIPFREIREKKEWRGR